MSFKKGNQLWKSRKTHKHSEETKQKIKEKKIKYFKEHPEARERIRLKQLGRKLTQKTKDKMRESSKKSINKGRWAKGTKPWNVGLTKEMDERLRRLSENRKGEGNPSWNNGSSSEYYPPEFREIKTKILFRDNFTCQECHRHQNELENILNIHHIDFNKKNNNSENLISLCTGCHGKTKNDRQDWIDYYQNKITENLGSGVN